MKAGFADCEGGRVDMTSYCVRGTTRRLTLTAVILSSLFLGACVSGPGANVTGKTITITLRPAAPPANGDNIPYVGVSVQFPVSTQTAASPLLRMPLVIANVKTKAASLKDIHAKDRDGAVVLTERDNRSGGRHYRRWTASRPIRGPLRVTYRVPISDVPN